MHFTSFFVTAWFEYGGPADRLIAKRERTPRVTWTIRMGRPRVRAKVKAISGGQRAARTPDVVEFTRDWLRFPADEQQERVLRGGRRTIVNCTRQWGKSTVAAAKAVYRAFS